MTRVITEAVQEFIETLAQHMHIACRIEVHREDRSAGPAISVALYSPEGARFLIGKNGQNLHALEYLVRAFCMRKYPEITNVLVDVNDYRQLKTQQVVDIARQAVARVRETQKAEALVPMTAYERRIVHMELAAHSDIATESIGQEPNRRVVIKPFSLDI